MLFETGPRLAATLADLAAGLGDSASGVLPRAHQAARGNPPRRPRSAGRELRAGAPRGEIVLVIAPPPASEPSAAETETLLRQALARVSLKDAVGEVADATGLPRREVYQRALALTKEAKDEKHGAPR